MPPQSLNGATLEARVAIPDAVPEFRSWSVALDQVLQLAGGFAEQPQGCFGSPKVLVGAARQG